VFGSGKPDRLAGCPTGSKYGTLVAVLRRFLVATYGGRAWRRLLYALLSGPLCCLGFLVVVLLCPPLLPVGLLGARGFGALYRWLARPLLGVAVPAPFGRLGSVLTDPTAWRSVLYLLVKLPVGLMTFVVTLMFWTVGGSALGYPFWYRTASHENSLGLRHSGIGFGTLHFDTLPRSLLVAGFGLVVLVLAPWLTRALLWPDIVLIRALLGPSRADRLRRTRALAVDDAADRLRRIERDLHDGAQAQLVALAMKLGLAREELAGGNPAAARALLEVAHHDAKQAILELRDLARGIHPPALDNGLEPALRTLAARGAVPVDLRFELTGRPAPAIETMAYFTAAELLTNVAKHSRARRACVKLTRPRDGRLRLTVHDDGIGGAHPGGGLRGLADRIHTVDGTLDIASPPGGPTTVTVELPDHA
jgi:signal transduction histidine kinase